MAVRDDWQYQRLLHSQLMAPRVVLVHGAPDRATSFRRVLPFLGDLDVVTYDRRGYGSAIGNATEAMTIADHAHDLLDVVADGPAVVVGHSFGGHVALAAAIAQPGPIASLGVWEPASPWADWWPDPSYAEGVATNAAGDRHGAPRPAIRPSRNGGRTLVPVGRDEAGRVCRRGGCVACRYRGPAEAAPTTSTP